MRSLLPERRRVNGHTLLEGAIAETHQALLAHLGQEIDRRLRAATEHVLGRAPYARRGHVPYSLEQTPACPQCGAQQSQRFSRNGSRKRHLVHPTVRHGPVPHRCQGAPPAGQKPPEALPLDRLGRLARA